VKDNVISIGVPSNEARQHCQQHKFERGVSESGHAPVIPHLPIELSLNYSVEKRRSEVEEENECA
jgi:hypothetical protein